MYLGPLRGELQNTDLGQYPPYDLLLPLDAPNVLANGTYYLRLVGYKPPGCARNGSWNV